MLDLQAVDLGDVALALEDHSEDGSWWIDADTGEVWCWFDDGDEDAEFDPENRPDARLIEPLPSSVGYRDMEEFIAQVRDRRPRELLERAIAGRGAFRRFKDTMFEFPELRERWFRFRDVRLRRRAIEFLVDEALVEEAAVAAELEALADPPVPDGDAGTDPFEVAAAVVADLRELYGSRLVEVLLYGSRARGDAHPDSDVDLAVVLDAVASPWEELRRMDDILWRHTLASGLTVSATPVSAEAWRAERGSFVRAARAEGVPVA